MTTTDPAAVSPHAEAAGMALAGLLLIVAAFTVFLPITLLALLVLFSRDHGPRLLHWGLRQLRGGR